jgi:phosphatidylserine/phosphatidylglycerophosphate/cardiolipin synthase-like enzyme
MPVSLAFAAPSAFLRPAPGRARAAFRSLLVMALTWFSFAGLAGCASLPPPVERPPMRALPEAQAQGTPLGRLVQAHAPATGVSGFHLVASGQEAYALLTLLADRAERTLDLQYYIIRSDESSRGILTHVRAAADRGVKVRLLVDDMNTAGQDEGLLRLTRHRNIEVRLYNPFPAGRFHTVSRVMSSLTDISRINQRMHNKMFVADNAIAITGGRNLGDTYFLQDPKTNFLDLDVLVAGPAVRRLSATFDAFWNQPLAYPVASIVPMPGPDAASAPASDPIAAAASAPVGAVAASAPAQRTAVGDSDFAQALARGQLKLMWAPARVLADKPSKIESGGQPSSDETMADDVATLMRSAREEVVIVSPYFVPGERGMRLATELASKGVKLRVLTNSLATTDAPAVHIGYARYRERLLRTGAEVFELRRRIDAPKSRVGSFGSSSASLHAKIIVVDRHTALVGSMNMDPRSEKLNSEMGVVIRSQVIAQQLVRLYEDVSATSYRVTLDGDGRLHWATQIDGQTVDATSEPEAKWWLKLGLQLLGPFAPEEML